MKSLPNILTFSRIAVIPFLIASFWIPGKLSHWVAAGLFAAASVTDFFDGYIARAMQSTSKLGKFFDPIADKLLVTVALVMLVHFDRAHLIPALLIICREIFVSGLREYLAEINISVPVSKLAKIKTGFQMVAIFLLLLAPGNADAKITMYLGNFSLWVAAALTLFTGYAYLKAGLRHMD